MKHKDPTGIIPAQYTGKEIEAEAMVILPDPTTAQQRYELAKRRLLYVNDWHSVAGQVSATFQLIDATGTVLNRPAAAGDFIRIDIPGPGSTAGDGYDWVRIEEMKETGNGNVKAIGFRVQPAANPLGEERITAHFYDAAASSNFLVLLDGCNLCAWIVDRNLKPNSQATSITDKIRDTAVGLGAIGVSLKFNGNNWLQD